jgi:CRP-like cAMP-binding protein
MFDNIKNNINSLSKLTNDEMIIFLSHMETKTIKQYDFYLKEGSVCKSVAFINKGLVRIYYVKNGKEYVRRFLEKDEWVTDYAGFLLKTPSLCFIEALEDTELFTLSFDNMQKLYSYSKSFEKFGRIIAEKVFIESNQRNVSLILNSSEELYLTLMKERPHLLNRIPLKYIASYIGVEPESLSRIRKRIKTQV